MSDFNDREKALENKYAKDQEKLFRIESRAAKLLGLWAAQEMGITGEDASAYAGDVIASNMKEPGLGDVIAKVSADLSAKGKSADQVSVMMDQFLKDAETQINAA